MAVSRSFDWRALVTPSRRRQLWYVPVLAVAMAVMMARSLVMARLLGIQAFAQFSGGILVSSSFGMLTCLGFQTILQREWPVAMLRGQEVRGLTRAAQCNLIAGGCLALLLIAVLGGASGGTLSPGVLALGLLHGFAQQVFSVATVESRSRGDALRFAAENLARALAIIAVGCLVALLTGSALEVLAAEALLTLALGIELQRRSAHYGRLSLWQLHRLALLRLPRAPWRSAVILMTIAGMAFPLVSLDRWMAAAALTTRDFAAYALAWTVLSVAQSAHQILNTTIYPTMVRRFATRGAPGAFRVCVASSALVLLAGAAGGLPAFYFLRYCVNTWYPKYAAAVAIVPLFLIVAVLRLADYWTTFLLTTGREGLLLFANIGALLGGGVLWLVCVYVPRQTTLQPVGAALLALILTVASYTTAMGCAWAVWMGRGRARVYS